MKNQPGGFKMVYAISPPSAFRSRWHSPQYSSEEFVSGLMSAFLGSADIFGGLGECHWSGSSGTFNLSALADNLLEQHKRAFHGISKIGALARDLTMVSVSVCNVVSVAPSI